MIRLLAFLSGLTGAVGLSQFPEFSQQYLQRLAGAVDQLEVIVDRFDADARRSDLTRAEALAEYAAAGGFLADQGEARADEIARFEGLSADYATLKALAPLQRLAHVTRFADPSIARRTWDDFRPAVPVTFDGLVCAAIGYGMAWALAMALLSAMLRLMCRPPRTAQS